MAFLYSVAEMPDPRLNMILFVFHVLWESAMCDISLLKNCCPPFDIVNDCSDFALCLSVSPIDTKLYLNWLSGGGINFLRVLFWNVTILHVPRT